MSNNPGIDGTNLPNTVVQPSGVDTSPPPLPANSAILPPPIDSPQVPIENASSGLVSDSSPSVPPTSAARGRKRNRGSKSVPGRKPGRPKKYGPEDASPQPSRVVRKVTKSQPSPSASAVPALPPLPAPPNYVSAALPPLPAPPNYVSAPLPPLPPSLSSSAKMPKRKPGRPFGTCKKPPTSGSTSTSPIPTITRPNHHIGIPACDVDMKAIIVSPGEDVVEKLTIFAQQDTKSIFISSAFGSVSSATLRPPTASTGSTTYEGLFQITSLSGSLIQVETQGQRTWIGGLSVSLTGHDNHNHVGGVAGSMIAATPVQIIVCSFNLENENKPERADHVNNTATGSLAANGPVNKSNSGGGVAVNKSNSVGGVADTSIPGGVADTSIPGGGVAVNKSNSDGGVADTSIPDNSGA